MTERATTTAGDGVNFLPNFCGMTSVFLVVVAGELLAFVLTLVQPGGGSWAFLGLISLYVQWVVLGSAALLCLLRRPLGRLGDLGGALASFAVIMGVTLAVSGCVALALGGQAWGNIAWGWVGRSLLVAGIIAAVVLRHLYVQQQWRRRIQGAASARIDALQARIRPHFLFNSLNTIAATIAADPRRAESLVEDLSDLFRASIGQSQRLIPLTDECRLANSYMNMERLRLGERLVLEQALEALPEDALIPPLTLQPLLENAVYYGVEPCEGGARLQLRGRREADELVVTVDNPVPPERCRTRPGFGTALNNVRERLQLAFGARATLTTREDDGVFRVTIRLPYRRGGGYEDSDRG
jgi:two-component system sensor histidine kinase AlgZ